MEELLTSSRNPVLQNMIARLDLAFFQDCDPTPRGKFSYQKVTQKITAKCGKSTSCILLRIFNSSNFEELKPAVEYFRYPGRTGPKSPIGTPLEILRYAALLPGPEGDAIRAAQADIAVRFRAGDHDLENATRHMRPSSRRCSCKEWPAAPTRNRSGIQRQIGKPTRHNSQNVAS
jgi:hypothetical protein